MTTQEPPRSASTQQPSLRREPRSSPVSANTARSAPPKTLPTERNRIGLGVIVFIATLLGSLLGVAADLNDAAGAFDRIRSLFDPELCIVGSNTILGDGINMASDWAASFADRHDVRVTINGIGSVRGVEEATNGGCVHVLAMSEPMTSEQYSALTNAGIGVQCAAEIGYDIISFVTDIDNDLAALNARVLPSILLGSVTRWSEVGGADVPIRILARPGSGTTEVVLINVARYRDPDITDDQYFPPGTTYIPCGSNTECLDATLSTPGSLYWVSTAWMRTQPSEYLRVMPILRGDERPVNPLTEEVNIDLYPASLVRPLYLYVLGGESIGAETQQLAQDFLRYVRSVQGQQILERYAFYTFFDRPREVNVTLPPGFEIDITGQRPVCLPSSTGLSGI